MKTTRKWGILILFDLLLVVLVFGGSGWIGRFPGWWISGSAACLWVLLGVISRKLNFTEFQRIRYAFITIGLVDVLSAVLLYALYEILELTFYGGGNYVIAVGSLILLECCFYLVVRLLVMRKIPFQQEDEAIKRYHRLSAKYAARMLTGEQSPDLKKLLELLRCHPMSNPVRWRNTYEARFARETKLMAIKEREELEGYSRGCFDMFVNLSRVNKIRRVNKFFIHVNKLLNVGDVFVCCCQTSEIRKSQILGIYPWGLNYLIYTTDYAWNRICPKLPCLKKIYFTLTGGRYRVFPRPEILGRLYCCGFEGKQEEYIHGLLYVIAVKTKPPFDDPSPSYGPLVRLRRVGKDGKLIGVYKFRTMHAYAEYLQPYIYQHNRLQEGGKFADDYRISVFGRFMRKCWLDELPMLINILKGDMKLIGVRPLSQHYYGLYSPELQQLRIRTKPGLLPPFYADMPKNLEEIEASERRYLEAYLQHPFLTDWNYFWKIWNNILIKRKRSA